MDKLVIGCGYLGARVATLWRNQGHRVHVLTRSVRRAEAWCEAGFLPIVGDVTQPETLTKLPAVTTVLWAVGYDRSSDYPIHEAIVRGLEHSLDGLQGRYDRFILISSTGVYHETEGAWVDETTVCRPARPSAVACLIAEQKLQAHAFADRTLILRLAGIYGPGRVPNRDMITQRKFSQVDLDRFLNLIHVEDATRCIEVADRLASTPRLYNVSDGCPVLRRDYARRIMDLFELSPDLLAADTLSADPLLGRSPSRADSKKVSNARLLAELPIQLRYKSYVNGLEACLAAESKCGSRPSRHEEMWPWFFPSVI